MKPNPSHWTLERQDAMCYGIVTKIMRSKYSAIGQIIHHADKFPLGLKQYYADRLLLFYVLQTRYNQGWK